MAGLGFGLIGCGNIGTKHADIILSLKNANLVAVCDIKKERAEKIAQKADKSEKIGCRIYGNYKEMLLNKDIDVVAICTPNGLHAQMAIDSMKAGKHVLCEKPMTITLRGAEKVVDVNKKTGMHFFLVKQNRFNPPVMAVKNAFREGKLGKVYLINTNVYWNRDENYYNKEAWRGTKRFDGGALFNQASHFLDLMLWFGGDVKSVFSVMRNVSHENIETEDLGTVIIKFKNGIIGTLNYTTSVYEKTFEGGIMVLGTKGTVKIGGKYLNELEFWNVEGVPSPDLEAANPKLDYGDYRKASNHDKVYKNVIDVLSENGTIATTSVEGRNSVEVMQAAVLSAIKKREIFLPLKGKEHDFMIGK